MEHVRPLLVLESVEHARSLEPLRCFLRVLDGAETHKGDFRGIAPTGRRWEATASAWYEVRDGKISDFWVNWDWLAIMEAIGAVQRVEPPA